MNIDIWSDIMCPFCYIGKRKLEVALAQFDHKDKINIIWHSFQLDPSIKYELGKDIYTYLAERKGQTREYWEKVHVNLVNSAKEEGLEYNFDISVLANTFDAHRLIQMAKQEGLGDAAEERLFRAYFTEGKNIEDKPTLIALGKEIGLNPALVNAMLNSNECAVDVEYDIATAQRYGITGVPFFVIDNKYGISGAQPSPVFLSTLQKAWKENVANTTLPDDTESGAMCSIDGNC